jgi:hypothetical protein
MRSMEHKRQRLISLIRKYLSQSNIQMKFALQRYETKLLKGKCLTVKELDSMLPLLVWNMKMSRDEVRHYYADLLKTHEMNQETTSTLDEFFI